jgi:hypothetical protein
MDPVARGGAALAATASIGHCGEIAQLVEHTTEKPARDCQHAASLPGRSQ